MISSEVSVISEGECFTEKFCSDIWDAGSLYILYIYGSPPLCPACLRRSVCKNNFIIGDSFTSSSRSL